MGYDAAPMAAPLPGDGGASGGGLTAEQARDFATIRDALLARFGTAGAGAPAAGGGGGGSGGGGGAPVVSGARSRKAASAGPRTLRQRLTVMAAGAGTAAGTGAGDEASGGNGAGGAHTTEVNRGSASQCASPFQAAAGQLPAFMQHSDHDGGDHDHGGVVSEESRRLRKELYRAAVVELAHAQVG
jgi:hypothetical protein